MSNDKYPKTEGGLYTNQYKKANNHPDWTGNVKISSAQIKNIIAMGKAGLEPKMKLAAWNRKSKEGWEGVFLHHSRSRVRRVEGFCAAP